MSFDIFSWVVIPLLIFLARVIDVSLGTLRFIFISRGYRKLAPLLGFFEVLVWLLAVREVMLNLRNLVCVFAYCGGFAMGNYVGLWLEERLSLGMVMLRAVLKKTPHQLAHFLKTHHYGFTVVEGEGTKTKVKILFSVIERKNLAHVLTALTKYHPQAFYSLENVKSAAAGIFPRPGKTVFRRLFREQRKSK